MRYDAFISYSHAADARLAPALERGLSHFAKPWNKRAAIRIFRDDTGLTTTPALWPSIEEALDESEWFVLLASPEAASSDWVERELDYWLRFKSWERILPVVTDGTWSWDRERKSLTTSSSAAPPRLAYAFVDEPRHLDLRWAKAANRLDLGDPRFRDAVADLSASIRGFRKDELSGEDLRQHRRTLRLARAAIVGLSTLLVIAVSFAFLAVRARAQARRGERVATAGRLAAAAAADAASQPDVALLLGVEAVHISDSPVTRAGLFSVLMATPRLGGLSYAPGGNITCSSLSPDGHRVALGDSTGRIREFDLRDSRLLARTFSAGMRAALACPEYIRGGRELLAWDAGTSGSGSIAVFDTTTGKRGWRVSLPGLARAAYVPVRDLVVTSTTDGDGQLRLWSARTGTPIGKPLVVRGGGAGLSVAPSGAAIAVDTEANRAETGIGMIDLATGRARASRNVYEYPLVYSPSGDRILLEQPSGEAVMRDAMTLAQIGPGFVGDQGRITHAAFSPDGKRIAIAGLNGSVVVWGVDGAERVPQRLVGLSGPVTGVAFNGSDSVVASDVTRIARWSLGAVPLGSVVTASRGSLTQVRDAARASVSASLDALGRVTLWSNRTRTKLLELPMRGVQSVDVNTDGRLLATGSGISPGEGSITLWDARTARMRARIGGLAGVWGLEFAPDAESLAADAGSGDVSLWNLRNGRPLFSIHTGGPRLWHETAFAFSAGGHYLAVGSYDNGASLYDTRTGRHLATFAAPGNITGLAYAPDGSRIAAVSSGGTLAVWNRVRRVTTRVHSPLGGMSHVSYTSDGSLIVATSPSGDIVVFDARSLTVLWSGAPPLGDSAISITSTGHAGELLVGTTSGRVVFWELARSGWAATACRLAGRNLTQAEWRQLVPGHRYHRTCPHWASGR